MDIELPDDDVAVGRESDLCDAPRSTPAARMEAVNGHMRRHQRSTAYIASWREDEPRCGRPLADHSDVQRAGCDSRAAQYAAWRARKAEEDANGGKPGRLTSERAVRLAVARRDFRRRYVDPATGIIPGQ